MGKPTQQLTNRGGQQRYISVHLNVDTGILKCCVKKPLIVLLLCTLAVLILAVGDATQTILSASMCPIHNNLAPY